MINFFRKIRKKLAAENNAAKYLRYAIGEILLIIVGIFLALQLQNWNEGRKQENQFKVVLEQLYNSVKNDIDLLQNERDQLDNQIVSIDSILNHPDSIPPVALPIMLYTLAQEPINNYTSEADYYLSNLIYNPGNPRQNELAKQITNYLSQIGAISSYTELGYANNELVSILTEQNIAFPKIIFTDDYRGFDNDDSTYYDKYDLQKTNELVTSRKLKTVLKTLMSHKKMLRIYASNIILDAESILQLIKAYYPEVKLLYQDVGIVGTAIDGYVNISSVPLIQTDFNNSIWELDIYLKEGTVKFRCRDSWNQNWGGNEFPKGTAMRDGENIPVEEGSYHIILNLNKNTYDFIKQSE